MNPVLDSSKARNNSQWFTSSDIPDPPLFTVPGYQILIRPAAPPQKTTKAGIILPESTQEVLGFTRAVGRVLALGRDAYKDEKKFPGGPWCKEGDWVLYGRHVGAKVIYGKVNLLILNDDEILGVGVDPALLFD